MSEERKALRIVPYSPNDYSLGEALTIENGTKSEDPTVINAAISLYFQWPEYRSGLLTNDSSPNATFVPCELDYDQDERLPTELRLKIMHHNFELKEFRKIRIRFEVFRTCYEFKSDVIAVSSEANEAGWNAIISVPNEILVYKVRRLPRRVVKEKDLEMIGSIKWSDSKMSESIDLSICEIGLRTIVVKKNEKICSEKESGAILLDGIEIPAEITRCLQDKTVISLCFKSCKEFGKYFDYYRLIAYPNLKERSSLNTEDILSLYIESGYFGKFAKEDLQKIKMTLPETWSLTQEGLHNTVADYYIVDESQKPIAAGSLALAFFEPPSLDQEIWFYHQNCALRIPHLIDQTADIYLWRTEYLAARPGEIKAAITYDSKSRWLERLYTKFARYAQNRAKIYPFNGVRCSIGIEKNKDFDHQKVHEYQVGRANRTTSCNSNYWAGIDPAYLNAAGGLNEIISAWNEDLTTEEIKNIASTLGSAAKKEEVTLRVLAHPSTDLTELNGTPLASDRLCIIPKSELTNLYASIEHSIAITKRKLDNG